jgi:hypothetical protein
MFVIYIRTYLLLFNSSGLFSSTVSINRFNSHEQKVLGSSLILRSLQDPETKKWKLVRSLSSHPGPVAADLRGGLQQQSVYTCSPRHSEACHKTVLGKNVAQGQPGQKFTKIPFQPMAGAVALACHSQHVGKHRQEDHGLGQPGHIH